MKFSLKTLLTVLLFATLLTNFCVLENRYQKSLENSESKARELEGNIRAAERIKDRAQDLERLELAKKKISKSLEHFKIGQGNLATHFRALADKQGQLTKRENQFSIKEIPTVGEHYMFSFRVFVPNSMTLELMTKFVESEKPQSKR